MLDDSPIFVLEVKGGRALPGALRMQMGRPLQPISFGSKGQWHVTGPGVRELHGYLKFDGVHLYLRSAAPDGSLRIDGSPVGDAWERVNPPCRISAGETTLGFALTAATPGHDTLVTEAPFHTLLDTTRIEPLEGPPHPSPSAAVNDTARLDVTHEDLGATRIDAAPPVPAPARPPRARGVLGHALPIDVPPAPPAVVAPARPHAFEVVRRQWRGATRSQRAIVLMLPFAFVAVHLLFTKPDKPTGRGNTEHPPAAPSSVPNLEVSTSSAAPPPAPIPSPIPAASGKTLARLAAEAFASGAYAEAVHRYDALAQQYPDQDVYREAARIVRSKLDAGVH
jgi:hypothetical protein